MNTIALRPSIWLPGPGVEVLRDRAITWGEKPSEIRRIWDQYLRWAGGKSDYLEEKIKDLVLGAEAFSAPGTVYFGLWDGTALTDTANGGTAGEVSGGSYDRVSKTNNTTNFASVTTAAKVNSNAITFPTASANWNSGNTIEQVGVLDGNAKTSGDNLLLWSDLTVAKAVLNGDTAQFNTSAFSWQED